MAKVLDYLFHLFTLVSNGVYHLKRFMNYNVFFLLSVIVAAGIVGDYNDLRRSYLAIALVIIFTAAFEKYIREASLYFDLMNVLISPVNVGIGMHKLVSYSKGAHLRLLLLLAFLELIIILASAYCMTILGVLFGSHTVFVNYCVLSLIAVESLLGLFIYLCASFLLLLIEDFYPKWLNWIAEANLPCILNHEVYLDSESVLHLKFIYEENT